MRLRVWLSLMLLAAGPLSGADSKPSFQQMQEVLSTQFEKIVLESRPTFPDIMTIEENQAKLVEIEKWIAEVDKTIPADAASQKRWKQPRDGAQQLIEKLKKHPYTVHHNFKLVVSLLIIKDFAPLDPKLSMFGQGVTLSTPFIKQSEALAVLTEIKTIKASMPQ